MVYRLPNVPQPGRTDLCVLRHPLGYDLAVMPDSLSLIPPNPSPGSSVTLRAIVENAGDLPAQSAQARFYDGDPQAGGTPISGVLTIPGTLIGGATQGVSVVWTVPIDPVSHTIYVVVDPALNLPDRDRANNVASKQAVLPDLAIQSCWHEAVSASQVALMARLTNAGAIPAGPVTVSWRLGAAQGEEVGRSTVGAIGAGQVCEVSYVWDTQGRVWNADFVPVFVVVDDANTIPEFNEQNNSAPMAVRVVPGWVPRFGRVESPDSGTVRLIFAAESAAPSEFTLESAPSLTKPITWTVEPGAVITSSSPGQFECQLPVAGSSMRFYRVGLAP
jgi:hypothetical protein